MERVDKETASERIKSINENFGLQASELIYPYILQEFKESNENAGDEDFTPESLAKEFIEQASPELNKNPITAVLVVMADEINRKILATEEKLQEFAPQLLDIQTKVSSFTQQSDSFSQKLERFQDKSDSLRDKLDQFATNKYVEAIIKEKLATQTVSLNNTLASQDSLNKLEEDLKSRINELKQSIQGDDGQSGLIGSVHELQKINISQNNSIGNLNKVIEGNDGKGGLVGKVDKLDTKIDQLNKSITEFKSESSRSQTASKILTQSVGIIAIIATLFIGYFTLSGGIAKNVQDKLKPEIDAIKESQTDLKTKLDNLEKILNQLKKEDEKQPAIPN